MPLPVSLFNQPKSYPLDFSESRNQHVDSAPGHDLEPDTSGPAPIGDYLPKLRLRVRTIPTLVWRDGAWRVEWIVVSFPELIHAAPRRLSNPVTESGRRA